MVKYFLIFLGTIFTGVGTIGIIVPGLPTTTFYLLAAACYMRSSEKLYNRLINHKIAGKFIRDYRENKAITRRQKIISLTMMWVSILTSAIFFIDNPYLDLILILCGVTGTFFILRIKTSSLKKDEILKVREESTGE